MDFSDDYDYDKLIEERPDYGFEFKYRNGHLEGNPRLLNKQDMIDIGMDYGNDQNLFIYCWKCCNYMDFAPGKNNLLDGKYTCMICGKSVKERTPYTQLERENETFLTEQDNDYEDYYDEDDDEEDSGEYYEEVYGELGDYTPWLDD